MTQRPQLDAGADTNDAASYYDHGLRELEGAPDRAAEAFYWATRLDPGWAEAYYARYIALHLSDKRRLRRYLRQERGVLAWPEIRQIDSLRVEAWLRDPFFDDQLDCLLGPDARLPDTYLRWRGAETYIHVPGTRPRDPAHAAKYAHCDREYQETAELLVRAITRDPRDHRLHARRADVFYHLQHFDSAAAALDATLRAMHARDTSEHVLVYESKALFEYRLARLHLRRGSVDSAVAALQRALTEDPSFHMAHAWLARIALARADTATALQALQLAVELRGSDVTTRYLYATVLATTGHTDDAIAQLRHAVAHEPFHAPPYLLLGVLHDTRGSYEDALRHYDQYAARAARAHESLPWAQKRLAELRAHLSALAQGAPTRLTPLTLTP